MVWISSISVARIGIWISVSVSVSVSISISVGIWMVSGISVPGIWISLSLSFCFSLLNNMNCSTTVSVVCVWFYVAVGIWMVSVCVWMVSSVGVWSYYYGFCGCFFSCLLFNLHFSGLDCWNVVVGVVRISVSVGVWMMVSGISTVEIVGISFGFRLGCCSSKKSENYELK